MGETENLLLHINQGNAIQLGLPVEEREDFVYKLIQDNLSDVMHKTCRVSNIWGSNSGELRQPFTDYCCPEGMIIKSSLA